MSRRAPRTACAGEAGSIFVETLVALAVLAMVLAGAYRVLADSAARRQQIEARRYAVLVARSALATVGSATPFAVGATEGVDGSEIWRIEMDRCGGGGSRAGTLYCIQVTVRAAAGGPALATLSTRRLAPPVT